MDNSIYSRWIRNKDYRGSFLHKLDYFLEGNDLNIETYKENQCNIMRNDFESWLNNNYSIKIDKYDIKVAEDFKTPWDAFDYFFEKNKHNTTYFSKGYNRLWLMNFE